jgi:3-dehydroquinate synthase
VKELYVDLKDRSYRIKIRRGILDSCGEEIRAVTKAGRLAVVSDSNVAPLYLERALKSLEKAGFSAFPIVFPAGERSKNLSTLGDIYGRLADGGLTRGDGVAALGGGVTGDMAGFAAATMFRGVDFFQIPTTLLAQVDSSVGGKTAVDLPQGKNLVGAFWQPKTVLIDPDCLETLPRRVLCDGMGEVVKYGMIANAGLFETLESVSGIEGLSGLWEDVVLTCCDEKRRLVVEDERDTGRRAILNFGHTLGHAYELAGHYEKYTHGEAVAAGMAEMLRVEEKRGRGAAGLRARLCTVLEKYGLPTEIPCTAEEYAAAIGLDKKAKGRTINLVEVTRPGSAEIVPTDVGELLRLLED